VKGGGGKTQNPWGKKKTMRREKDDVYGALDVLSDLHRGREPSSNWTAVMSASSNGKKKKKKRKEKHSLSAKKISSRKGIRS